MNTNFVKISVKSDNPDLAGNWCKADVEEEMSELGYSEDMNWIEYVVDHVFADLPLEFQPLFNLLAAGLVDRIDFQAGGHAVSVRMN